MPSGAAGARFAELLSKLPDCRRRTLARGQWLRPSAVLQDCHLLLESGAALVLRNGMALALLGPGDCFSTEEDGGSNYLRGSDVLAVTPTTFLVLPAGRYFAVLRQNAELSATAVAAHAESKSWNLLYHQALARRDPVRRLASVSALFLGRSGSICPLVGGRFALLPQSVLAVMCRLSRQAVNRALAWLRLRRLLYSGRGFLCAPDLQVLWEVTEGHLQHDPAPPAHCKLRHPEEPLDCRPLP